uniref:Uncharacterized protein n=1 Tax=Romanomermis culicivorax TaxID=13658 RepID=A0A915IGC0_ROMCU
MSFDSETAHLIDRVQTKAFYRVKLVGSGYGGTLGCCKGAQKTDKLEALKLEEEIGRPFHGFLKL